jgi:hypothetical protein
MWLNLAAATGDLEALKNRDLVAALMTHKQVAEAQKLTRDCQARNFADCD